MCNKTYYNNDNKFCTHIINIAFRKKCCDVDQIYFDFFFDFTNKHTVYSKYVALIEFVICVCVFVFVWSDILACIDI